MFRLLTAVTFALVLSCTLLAHGETITGVTFSGSAANPTITVSGTGFLPAPTGNTTPFDTYGTTGENFGMSGLFIGDLTGSWSAGQNFATSIDSVGLLNVTYTDTLITFQFGSGYAYYNLAQGDAFYLQARDASYSGNVDYPAAAPEPAEILLTLTGLFGVGAETMRRRMRLA